MNISELKRRYTQQNIGSSTVSEILLQATRLHCGWDMDNFVWLVKLSDGTKEALATDHGSLYKIDPTELIEAISEAAQSIKELTAILEVM